MAGTEKLRYRLGAQLGVGGQSVVFRATSKTTGEEVALKRTKDSPEARQRLRREIDAMRRHPGPHVMALLDVDEADPPSWFSMPIAEGSLESLRPQLAIEDLPQVLRQACAGLAAAHAGGDVHRDVNPRNLLAYPDPNMPGGRRWVMADWGLIRPGPEVATVTRTHIGMGTEGFIAPECQDNARYATAAADVYGLGRISVWFLTGRRLRENLTEPIADEHGQWRSLVRQSTEHDPGRRTPDTASFLELVYALEEGPPSSPELEAPALVARLKSNFYAADLQRLTGIALDMAADHAMYIDVLSGLPERVLARWASDDASGLTRVTQNMLIHLETRDLGNRHWSAADDPLNFARQAASALLDRGHADTAESLLERFFRVAPGYSQFAECKATRSWLATVPAESAALAARALAAGRTGGWYAEAADDPRTRPEIRAVLRTT